jgi:hypothetical protein
MRFFTLLANDERACAGALQQLYRFQHDLDKVLTPLIASSQMYAYLAYQIVQQQQSTFEELNELWMISDQIVRQVAI